MLTTVPIDIFYLIINMLSPFDIINFINIFPLQLHRSFEFDLHESILLFSEGNIPLVNVIHQIIKQEKRVDYDILNMFKDIYIILKRTSKYMDILGYSQYIFIINSGSYAIKIENLFTQDSQLIYLTIPDVNKLCYYIDTYLQFHKIENDSSSFHYMIRNYSIKKFLK